MKANRVAALFAFSYGINVLVALLAVRWRRRRRTKSVSSLLGEFFSSCNTLPSLGSSGASAGCHMVLLTLSRTFHHLMSSVVALVSRGLDEKGLVGLLER